MAEKEKQEVKEKIVKVVVVNGFSVGINGKAKMFKRGDVTELPESLATKFGAYDGCLPRDIHVKPFDKVGKEELADLNKVNAVDKAPHKGNAQGVSK